MADSIACDYFDGLSARPRAVRLRFEDGWLVIEGEPDTATRVRLADVQFPERRRHGPRVTHLRGGGSLHCADAAGWDAWLRGQGRHESWVVKAQQSWRATLAAAVALVAVCAALYVWGLPLAARGTLAFVPPGVDAQLGEAALQALRDRGLLKPSAVPPAQQQRLAAALNAALAKAYGARAPVVVLHFHKSRIGPNAFALPGGTVVVTDELVTLLEGRDELLLGVLGHEAGHLLHRHGMRALVQTTLLSSITALAFGDFSNVLAGAPALLGHMAYSRDFEREADGEAIRVLRAAGLSPALMVTVFERLHAEHAKQGGEVGIALASHPADAERISRFRNAAATQ